MMDPFFTKDGKEVKTLSEMADALENMSEEDYTHHITPQKNDVAIWVENVHKNEELAKALGQAKDRETTIALLKEMDQAVFPVQEEYHPATGFGKEDAEIHDTYNKQDEWDAAKDAAHPEEEVQNPATGEVSKGNNLANIAEEFNKKIEEVQNDAPVVPEDKIESSNDANEPVETATSSSPAQNMVIPEDLSPPKPTDNKDRLIFLLIGLIIGLIIGYGLSLVI